MKFSQLALGMGVATIALTGSAISVEAASITGQWEAHAAISDQYGGSGDGHAVWRLFDQDYLAGNKGLYFTTYDDGSATFTGNIQGKDDSNNKVWDINLTLAGLDEPGNGGPKKELKGEAYSTGVVDTTTWDFYSIVEESSTITSKSSDETYHIYDASNGKYPFQVGIGANGKNVNFGASTWFKLSDTNGVRLGGRHSDINVDLKAVPEPASALAVLAVGAVAAGGAMKKKQSV